MGMMPDKSQPFVFIARIVELSLVRAGSFDLLPDPVTYSEQLALIRGGPWRVQPSVP